MAKDFDLSLYLVTDRPLARGRDMRWIVEEAVRGGCTIVQLREKDCDTRTFVDLALQLKAELSKTGVPLIINDRLDVALAVDADGVHIGQSDMPYELARKMLGPDKIIGLSVENMDDLHKANELDVDYIGISPVFSTATKTDTARPFGLDGAREAMALSRHPAVGIGGMNHRTAKDVMACGVDGIAVVSDIVSADSPMESSRTLLEIVRSAQGSWCDNAWAVAAPVFERIKAHPFIQGMIDGSLPMELFERYLAQDRIYLENYTVEMNAMVAMLPDGPAREMFRLFARDSMDAELALNEKLSSSAAAPALPLTSGYMAHTRKLIDAGDRSLSIASLLPCMWLYNELGKYMMEEMKGGDANPYREWISLYSSPLMEQGVPVMQALANELAEAESAVRKAEMRYVFCQSCRYELGFFQQITNE